MGATPTGFTIGNNAPVMRRTSLNISATRSCRASGGMRPLSSSAVSLVIATHSRPPDPPPAVIEFAMRIQAYRLAEPLARFIHVAMVRQKRNPRFSNDTPDSGSASTAALNS